MAGVGAAIPAVNSVSGTARGDQEAVVLAEVGELSGPGVHGAEARSAELGHDLSAERSTEVLRQSERPGKGHFRIHPFRIRSTFFNVTRLDFDIKTTPFY